ncbi:lactate racemase domain-containing protein [bacterium]|nr:lactate racemase domain-containing protein [bacterium]
MPSRSETKEALLVAEGSSSTEISDEQMRDLVGQLLREIGPLSRVLLVPPDYTRIDSGAGPITVELYRQLAGSAFVSVLPALGTHDPLPARQRTKMFPGIPAEAFYEHRWREDLVRLGEVDADFVEQVSGGAVCYDVPIEVNRMLVEGEWDRIISIGQLVPHEVIGVANHVKNILIGVGGKETIHKSHYLGAVYGMERIMGQADSPVRAVLQEGMNRFGQDLPITYVLTVRGFRSHDKLVTRGFYAGDGVLPFRAGVGLCQECNITRVPSGIRKAVVWLDGEKYHSTWLGNKAIYRTRMALADDAELIILAPGVRTFGEDEQIDHLIRAFGYRGTKATVDAVERGTELADNLAAAAHLIHGSSEGRFRITYAPGGLSRDEIEGVGFGYLDLNQALSRYSPDRLQEGINVLEEEEIFFIRHPGQGLWNRST